MSCLVDLKVFESNWEGVSFDYRSINYGGQWKECCAVIEKQHVYVFP